MTRPRRLSPLITYQLRKLIRSRETELSWNNPTLKYPVSLDGFFLQVNDQNPDSAISIDLLDRLITLHQSLTKTHELDSPYLLDIESSIYESLGMKWNKPKRSKSNESVPAEKSYLQRCRDLLRQLNTMREQAESLVGLEATLSHLIKSRPDYEWCLKFKVSESGSIAYDGNINELMTRSRLKIYEQWMESFHHSCQTIIPTFPLHTTASLNSQTNEIVRDNKWVNLHKIANLESISNPKIPLRSRDLLKHLQNLQQEITSIISPQSAISYLQNSRPENDWSRMFNISETGSISYSGNIRELVTNSRSRIYETWINEFIKKCQIHISTAEKQES